MKTLTKKSSESEKYNILTSSIFQIVLNVGTPLLAVYAISIFATSYVNEVYSQYLGKTVFLVTGVLSSIVALFGHAYGCTNSGTWIRTAAIYAKGDRDRINTAAINSLYTVVIMSLSAMVILTVGKGIIFRLMNVPEAIEWETSMYYYVQAASMPILGISSMLNLILTANSSKGVIFLENLLLSCRAAITAALFIAALKLGFWGWLLGTIPVTLAHIAIQIFFLRKRGILVKVKKANFRPLWEKIGGNIKYGCVLFVQMLLCVIGNMVVAMQSNRYLDMDVIATISIVLPLSSVTGICSTLCSVFVPQNYGSGKTERVKRFIYGAIIFGVIYSVACSAFYALAGEWYFGTLFDDPTMIELGKQYWFWSGLSMLPLAMIQIVRLFFDSVGLAKISMLSGVGELVGRSFCAFVLIPYFGTIGLFSQQVIGWGAGGFMMVLMFIIKHKEIFRKCDEKRLAAERAED